jgi:hypothetical protein
MTGRKTRSRTASEAFRAQDLSTKSDTGEAVPTLLDPPSTIEPSLNTTDAMALVTTDKQGQVANTEEVIFFDKTGRFNDAAAFARYINDEEDQAVKY